MTVGGDRTRLGEGRGAFCLQLSADIGQREVAQRIACGAADKRIRACPSGGWCPTGGFGLADEAFLG